jgi:hypothetical protein
MGSRILNRISEEIPQAKPLLNYLQKNGTNAQKSLFVTKKPIAKSNSRKAAPSVLIFSILKSGLPFALIPHAFLTKK